MPLKGDQIPIPNPLKDKVSYGEGGIDQDVLARAEAVVAAMQGDYLNWVQDDLTRLADHYDTATRQPVAERAAAMRDMFGISHDIKGQGGSFGYGLVTTIGNQLCRFIEAHDSFDTPQMNIIGLHIEALRVVIAERLEGDGGPQGQELLAGLQAVLGKAGF